MRNLLIFFVLLLHAGVFCQDLDFSWIDEDANSKAGALSRQFKSFDSDIGNEYDLTYLRLLFTVDPGVHYITGSVTSYFRVLTEPPHTLTFDMHDSLRVNRIVYHGNLLTTYSHDNDVLTISLPGAMPYHQLDSIMVDYEGAPVDDGSGSFSTGEHNGVPVLSTLSEPYGAKDWWPCKQNLNDKIDSVMVVVTCPDDYRTASNGVLISERLCHDQRVMIWKHNHPIAAYLIAISVTNYEVYSDYVITHTGISTQALASSGKPHLLRWEIAPSPAAPCEGVPDSIQILNYVYPENLESAKSQTPGIIEVFNIYNELFGIYPYADEKYGHAQWEWGGGMEHQTMGFMGSFGHDLMAHELAHQWFGDYVTCGSWQDIWLNEGFATYLTGLTYERMFNGRYWKQFKSLSIDRIVREPDGSVFCTDTSDVDRIFDARLSYSKGAMVLHSLRWEMGDDAFFEGIRSYYNDNANGYAYTADLQAHLEVAADTTFQEFFNDWVYGEGYPEYSVDYSQLPSGELEITINQTQTDQSVDFFEMHVPIQLIGDNIDTTFIFHNTHNNQTFTCNPGGTINRLLFDPGRWIITKDPIVLNKEEIPLQESVTIFPNPASDKITISIKGSIREYSIEILSLQGKRLLSRTGIVGKASVTLDISSLPTGVYLVQVRYKGVQHIKKLILK